MSILILKGQGVTYEDPETGQIVPMSFPERDDVNPFFVKPGTNELVDQEKFPHKWPMEAVAEHVARDFIKEHPGTDYATALKLAKDLLNQSVVKFNQAMDAKGDPSHRLPFYFNTQGQLNPDWAKVNYGLYQDKKTPSHERKTNNSNGIVTFHVNNHPHPRLGHFPESGAFPSWREFGEMMDAMFIPSLMGLNPHIDPHHQVVGGAGERGPVKRHLTTHPDPFGPYGQSEAEKSRREPLHVDQVIAGLDPVFFSPKRQFSQASRENLLAQGMDDASATAMAQSVAGSFFNEDEAKGETGGVNTVMSHLTQKVMQQSKLGPEEIQRWMQKYVRGYQAVGMEEKGIHHDNAQMLIQALALSEVARVTGASSMEEARYSPAGAGFHRLTRGARAPELIPVQDPDRSFDDAHVRPDLPMDFSDYSAFQGALAPETMGPGRSAGEPLGEYAITQSHDNITSLMETLQMADARLDTSIMKAIPQDSDASGLAATFGLTVNDVALISQSRGDWERVAKTLMLPPHVVRVVKVSLGASK